MAKYGQNRPFGLLDQSCLCLLLTAKMSFRSSYCEKFANSWIKISSSSTSSPLRPHLLLIPKILPSRRGQNIEQNRPFGLLDQSCLCLLLTAKSLLILGLKFCYHAEIIKLWAKSILWPLRPLFPVGPLNLQKVVSE
jgi:hypothetical protein